MRYLATNIEGYVINIIEWDGVTPYHPIGITLYKCIDYPEVTYGWQYVDGEWIPPEPTNIDEV